MPDYNKGDFTQQGIDGFVEGGLHLNEKRCLTAKISTDEDSAGLDSVEINIHDHLNDLDYTITGENLVVGENTIGGGGGHLSTVEFEENGTYYPFDYEAYGFGEVTVNVSGGGGGGDVELLYTTINIINNDEVSKTITGSLANYGIVTDEKYFFTTADAQEELNMTSLNETVAANSTKTLTFYYVPYSMENIAFAVIIAKGDNDTADNMVWTNNAWVVSDTAANSTLNIVLDK